MEKVYKIDKELFSKILNDSDLDEEEELCLITNEKLENNSIKLLCGHKFNYEALYNEIVYQKTRKLLDNAQLKCNEVKCPYCRTITGKLLPFYKYYSVKQVRGVTYPEEYCMKIVECEHEKNGKKCSKAGCKTEKGVFCNKHLPMTKIEEEILKNEKVDVFKYYKRKKVNELKKILSLNKCKVGGNKEQLINRIIINKTNIKNWIEN